MSKANEAAGGRNIKVERAVSAVLERIDDFIAGHELQPLEASLREACDLLLEEQSASARTAGQATSRPDPRERAVPVCRDVTGAVRAKSNHATSKRARRRWYELVSVPTTWRD